jgi:caa(3)-type oxidase subunit IV
MSETHAPSYALYWKAWLALLAITVTMVFVGSTPVVVAGIAAKAAIILLWFMHMRYERLDFALFVLVSMFFLALVLFGLIVPDGRAM